MEAIDLGRYLDDLVGDMRVTMGGDWADRLTLDLAPMLVSADRAVHVGLILTELVINAQKYAYGGSAGPIAIGLEQYRNQFRMIVADRGGGKTRTREGFGTRMMNAMVQRLDGTIEQGDNHPGLRVIVERTDRVRARAASSVTRSLIRHLGLEPGSRFFTYAAGRSGTPGRARGDGARRAERVTAAAPAPLPAARPSATFAA